MTGDSDGTRQRGDANAAPVPKDCQARPSPKGGQMTQTNPVSPQGEGVATNAKLSAVGTRVEREIIDAIEAQFDIHAMDPEDWAEMWTAIGRALQPLERYHTALEEIAETLLINDDADEQMQQIARTALGQP